jgi:septal ring factor EnvC (AmiA/AmiB activator)
MSLHNEKEIQELKSLIEQKQADKIRLETKLANILEQMADLEKQCKDLGIDPENLSHEIQSREEEIEACLSKARAYLAGEEVEDDDEPF